MASGFKKNKFNGLGSCLKMEFHFPIAVGQATNRAIDGHLTVNFFHYT